MAPFNPLALLLFASTAVAFPFLDPSAANAHTSQSRSLHPRASSLTNYTTAQLATLVNGILSGKLPGYTFPPIVLAGVPFPTVIEVPPVATVGRKAIPDAAHPFQAPGPSDQRGGCPGLNNMANYGYLDRSGIATISQVLYATQEMFPFGTDIAAGFIAVAISAGAVDLTTTKMSIGNTDSRTNGPYSSLIGQVPGLFAKETHGRFETDGSVAYTDSPLTTDGFGGHFDSQRWAEAASLAAGRPGGLFDSVWSGDLRYKRYQECIATNPNCTWGIKQVVGYGATSLPWALLPSSDASGKPGPPTSFPISTFWGAQQLPNGTYVKVPEQVPALSPGTTYYRRGTPMPLVEIVNDMVRNYAQHPVLFGANSGRVSSFVPIPNQTPLSAASICALLNVLQEDAPPQYESVRESFVDFMRLFLAPARVSLGCS